MTLDMYQIDAFTTELFRGNPAAVVPLSEWLQDDVMQKIAAENNLSDTAFFVGKKGQYDLRWFTPLAEVNLCGHATLASAWVICYRLNDKENTLRFQTRSGELIVSRAENSLIMDFPSNPAYQCEPPAKLIEAISVQPQEVLQAEDYFVVLENEQQVLAMKPDLRLLKHIPLRAVVVTAPSDRVDFVSRMFAPKLGIDEDPVTGSSHCSLTPYWVERLGRTKLAARQLSSRGGELQCELIGDRVKLIGQCVEYMQATINI